MKIASNSMSGGRRDRSRSPLAVDGAGRRRGASNSKKSTSQMTMDKLNDNMTNPMAGMNSMMMNNMYQQENTDNMSEDILDDSQPVSEPSTSQQQYSPVSIFPSTSQTTPSATVSTQHSVGHTPPPPPTQTPPPPRPMPSVISASKSQQKAKNTILVNEFNERQRRANELHELELLLLREKIREAKAKADLAELQLRAAGNMMMGGMYPNMMMGGGMMGSGMMPNSSMDLMSSSGMDMSSMDMSNMTPTPSLTSGSVPTGSSMDMALASNMMGGMMMDPSMMAMGGMGGTVPNMPNISLYNMQSEMMPVLEKKEVILKHCKLTPAPIGTPDPPKREKPPGCRTIFVGGLPDKIRESTVRDIFERYGRIQTLRLSKKNFCHIRFDREGCVDAAMILSGYSIKLIDKEKEGEEEEESHANSGWLHVDYALSRDDQNEYERRQRQVLRVQQQQLEQMNAQQGIMTGGLGSVSTHQRSPSPVRILPFSNLAIAQVAEKIKSEENFACTLPTLVSWLERGECSKKNANQFYSMIQATNSHIRRLFNEKMQSEEELQECKERIKNNIKTVIEQLEQVARVFSAAGHQRVWDHFTKAQRKNIETWQKMTQEFSTLKDEFNEKFSNEDNVMDYNNAVQGYNNMDNMGVVDMGVVDNEYAQQLKRENDSLSFQLEAYKNEVDVIKAEAKKEMEKFKAQYIARQVLQGTLGMPEQKLPPLPSPVVKPPPPPPLPDDLDSKVHLKKEVEAGCGEAKLIGVMSAFLQVHPHGASLDYVVSYVRALFQHVSQATVHHVLQKHPDVFQLTTSGVGANIENRWSFVAFAADKAADAGQTASA